MTNFAQPVSMPCTEEQYNRDLKDGLEKLGYEQAYELRRWEEYSMITTKYDNVSNYYGLVGEQAAKERGRHFIDHFNPELFLAIAGMREGEEVHVGEWMITKRKFNPWGHPYKKGQLVKCKDLKGGGTSGSFVKVKPSHSNWRKATLSELINHFKKEKMYPLINNKQWYAENGTVYNGADETVRIVLLHDSGSYNNLPNEVAEVTAKAMNGQLPKKEHRFKFGDKVLANNGAKLLGIPCMFVANGQSGKYLVINECDRSKMMAGQSVVIYPCDLCEPIPEPLKITRSEIAEWKGTDKFEIV